MHYLSPDLVKQIEEVVDEYAFGAGDLTPDTLLDRAIDLLPIEKQHTDTIRKRVEGLHYLSELLWNRALETGKLNRQQIVVKARLRPLSYYHYLTGSREPSNILLTRDDLLNDPPTGLVKLRDDILGLARVLPELQSESTATS